MNNENNNVSIGSNEEQETIKIVVSKEISKHPDEMMSDIYFANIVRKYYDNHKKEYTELLKKYKNDFSTMCCELSRELNLLLTELVLPSKEFVKLDKETKSLEKKIAKMKEQGVPETDADMLKAQTQRLSNLKTLSRMESLEVQDKSYKSTFFSGLINKMKQELADIEQESEPSDIEARKNVKFEKKMSLEESLFTLLWNTRSETIPLSVLNIKAWAASLVQRIMLGEAHRTNLPTMLIFRSRTDDGTRKGSSGKSTIAYSCCNLFKDKGLNVAGQGSGVKIPTTERVDKKMSDKTLTLFEDMVYTSVAWEDLNQFLDGLPIKNKGKYLKEGAVFGFGNVIGTTNYDMPYENLKRYPQVEFTPNDAAIGSKHKCVKEHAKYFQDQKNRVFDFKDAWETLFSYACENFEQWLWEYENRKEFIRKNCSVQKSKLENLIIAFFEHKSLYGSGRTFYPSEIIEFIRTNFKGEFSASPKISTVISALENLNVSEMPGARTIYDRSFIYPQTPSATLVSNDPIVAVWNWIENNASKAID